MSDSVNLNQYATRSVTRLSRQGTGAEGHSFRAFRTNLIAHSLAVSASVRCSARPTLPRHVHLMQRDFAHFGLAGFDVGT